LDQVRPTSTPPDVDATPEATPPEVSEDPVTPKAWVDMMVPEESSLPADLKGIVDVYTPSKQFNCWFNSATQDRLHDLLRQQNPEKDQFVEAVRKAFDQCVEEEYDFSRNTLAVFGAQVAVHKVLTRWESSGWDQGCAHGPAAAPAYLRDFKATGKGGGPTFNLLNGFLACTGLSSRLTIDGNSKVQEYLFTTYVALKELQREP
jgi:hypothetical protein